MKNIMPKIILIIKQVELTWYLGRCINETSLTICQHIQLAIQVFSTAELMCSLGNNVTKECLLK